MNCLYIKRELDGLIRQKTLSGINLDPLISRKLIIFLLRLFKSFLTVKISEWQKYIKKYRPNSSKACYRLSDALFLFSKPLKELLAAVLTPQQKSNEEWVR